MLERERPEKECMPLQRATSQDKHIVQEMVSYRVTDSHSKKVACNQA